MSNTGLGSGTIIRWPKSTSGLEFDPQPSVTITPQVYVTTKSRSGAPRAAAVAVTAERFRAMPWTQMGTRFPEIVPPERTWLRGPKSANVDLRGYGSIALALDADDGVAFYRWGLEPLIGCKTYFEFVCDATAATVGGFGIGSVLTETTSEPGKANNSGVMLYYESGVYTLWVDGVSTVVSGPASPLRFGVGIEALAADSLSVRFWVNGTPVGSAVVWALSGPIWIPVTCLKLDELSVTFEWSAPTGYRPLSPYCGVRMDPEQPCEEAGEALTFLLQHTGYEAAAATSPVALGTGIYIGTTFQNFLYSNAGGGRSMSLVPANHEAAVVSFQGPAHSEYYNQYWVWTNTTGSDVEITKIVLSASGAVGTSYPSTNAVGIGGGVGAVSLWEAGSDANRQERAAITIDQLGVGFRVMGDDFEMTHDEEGNPTFIPMDEGEQLIEGFDGLRWFDSWSASYVVNSNQNPRATPFSKTFTPTDALVVKADRDLWIEFFTTVGGDDNSEGYPLVVTAPMTVEFHVR